MTATRSATSGGNCEDARLTSTRASATPENLATAHLNRANIYAHRGKQDLALGDYAAAMALDPRNPLAPYNRGNLHFDAEAVRLGDRGLYASRGARWRIRARVLNRGLAHEWLGDTVAAAKDYGQALAIDPTSKAAQKRLERLNSQ